METGAAHVDEPFPPPPASPAPPAVMGARNWALVTPDMLVSALSRAGRRRRRGREGSAVRCVARCLAERYPLCPSRPALLQEIRLKLQCCVRVGILRHEGDWFVPVSTGAGPSRSQLASFWQLYLAASRQEGAATPRARVSRQPRAPSPPLHRQPPPQHPQPLFNPPLHHRHHYHQVYHIHVRHAAQPGLAAPTAAMSWPAHAPPPPPPPLPPWQVLTVAAPDVLVSDISEDTDDEQRLVSLDLAEPRRPPRGQRTPPPTEEPGAEPEPPPPRLLLPPAGRPHPLVGLYSDGSEEWDDLPPAPSATRPLDPRTPSSSSALSDTAWNVDNPPRPRSPTPPLEDLTLPMGPLPAPSRSRSPHKPLRSKSAPPEDHPGHKIFRQRTPKQRPQIRKRRGRR